ncbi:phosphopantetheine-binding protein [Streptosporangium sp. NPDC003464]
MTVNHLNDLSLPAVEKRVEDIWRYVLRMPEEQKNATFFELQGHSVSAIRIASRIEDELGISIDVSALFEDPSMQDFVRTVVAQAESAGIGG